MGALIICLADAISLDVVEGMAKLKEELNPEIMRVVGGSGTPPKGHRGADSQ